MISVIVPAFNEEKLIGKCLASLARQNPLPDEIVVVDNASTDRTSEVVTQFIQDHPHLDIKLLYESKKGPAPARETGWRNAKGDIIVQLDADETLPADWMQKIHTTLAKYPDLGAFGGTYHFEHPPLIIRCTQFLYNRLNSPFFQLTKGFPYLCGGQTVCKREVLEKMNGYLDLPPDQLEDYYLSAQAHRLGYKLRFFPHIFGIHSIRRYEQGGLKAWFNWGIAAQDADLYEMKE